MVAHVTASFFVRGFATVLVESLIPRLKAPFELSFAKGMLTQFSFFIAYLLVSIPAGRLFVPAACYLYIASYGWFARQEVRP
jgi:FHS family L-fucose permease-like MFS transporter